MTLTIRLKVFFYTTVLEKVCLEKKIYGQFIVQGSFNKIWIIYLSLKIHDTYN